MEPGEGRPTSPLPGKDGLTTAWREELLRLRRQARQIQIERDILAKATAWFTGKNGRSSNSSSLARGRLAKTLTGAFDRLLLRRDRWNANPGHGQASPKCVPGLLRAICSSSLGN
jgi:hypothetical protein